MTNNAIVIESNFKQQDFIADKFSYKKIFLTEREETNYFTDNNLLKLLFLISFKYLDSLLLKALQ